MKSSNRTLWIVLAVALVLLCGCCFALMMILAPAFLLGIPWSRDTGMIPSLPSTRVTETAEYGFTVGDAPELVIDSFAGDVDIGPGTDNEIQVVVTKSARNQVDLNRVKIEMQDKDGGVSIVSSAPASLHNAWVKLEIKTPADTKVKMETGSGSVNMVGLDGAIMAHTGSGSIELLDVAKSVDASTGSGGITVVGPRGDVIAHTGSGRIQIGNVEGMIDASTNSGGLSVYNAEGQVQLGTKSGSIQYDGTPSGDCRFETSSGSITLDLPSDLDMAIDLSTTAGSVDVRCDLVGRATSKSAEGVVGDGLNGKIFARTKSGGIAVNCR